MVRILKATGVLSLLLAAMVLVLVARMQLRGYPRAESMGIVSAVERFTQMNAETADQEQPQIPPLIQQAQAFALYLNPPPAPQPQATSTVVREPPPPVPQAKPTSSSLKFELHGISYYRSRPAESMALVREGGSGRRWVRQGDKLGHITIEKITSTSILWTDGEHTQEMALASNQALTTYAKDHSEKTVPQPSVPDFGKPAPPPVRGIRQMPASYAAAKMGLQLGQVEAPGEGTTDSR